MKKLDVLQMEGLQGATNQRNCMIMGGLIAGTAIAGFFSGGAAWLASAGIAAAAAQADCF